MKTLSEVRKYLKSIPNINYGGCGIAAYAMYIWLKKNGNKSNIKFIYLYSESSIGSYENNSIVLSHRKYYKTYASSCSHVMIKVGNNIMDCANERIDLSSGVYPLLSMEIQEVHITQSIKFIKNSLSKEDQWNCSFNRGKYLPLIEKKLGISLDLSI